MLRDTSAADWHWTTYYNARILNAREDTLIASAKLWSQTMFLVLERFDTMLSISCRIQDRALMHRVHRRRPIAHGGRSGCACIEFTSQVDFVRAYECNGHMETLR